jgi:hypothetical protein
LVAFGRLMQRIVEAVARQAHLTPAEPLPGVAAPSIGAERTA